MSALPRAPSPGRRARLLVALLLVAVFAAELGWLQRWLMDDAYISFRYADHWLSGEGLVFNAGQRVWGYTNFLWTALLALAHGAGLSYELAARGLGLLSALAGVAAAAAMAERAAAGAGLLSALLLVSTGLLPAWALSGLESALFFALSAAALSAAGEARDPRGAALSGLLAGLATLTRPEGGLVAVAAGLLCLVHGGPRRALAAAGGGAALVLPLLLLAHDYYGSWLPNTFYAKMTPLPERLAQGQHYLRGHLVATAPLWLLAAWGAWRRPAARPLAGFALIAALAIVWAGGDHFPSWRMTAPLLAPLCVAAALGLLACGRWASGLAAAAGLWCALFFLPEGRRMQEGDAAMGVGRAVGMWLRDHVPADTVIALNSAGATPFFSGLRTVDMLGLTDDTIARSPKVAVPEGLPPAASAVGHRSANGAYVLAQAPDLVILGPAAGSTEASFLSDWQLLAQPDFKRDYVPVSVDIGLVVAGQPRPLILCLRSAERGGRVPLGGGPITGSSAPR